MSDGVHTTRGYPVDEPRFNAPRGSESYRSGAEACPTAATFHAAGAVIRSDSVARCPGSCRVGIHAEEV